MAEKCAKLWATVVALGLLLLAGHVGAASPCYRYFDSAGKLVYEGRRPPFDVSTGSGALAESTRRGEHLVWFASEACREEAAEGELAGPVLQFHRAALDAVILDRAPESFYGRRLFSVPEGAAFSGAESFGRGAAAAGATDAGSAGYSSGSGEYGRLRTMSPRASPGTDVQVRGYTRKDGTYVRPHTRSSPRR